MMSDTLTRIFQIFDIIEGIEITNGCRSVFFKHFGMQIDHFTTARIEHHRIHPACKGLKICIRPYDSTKTIHHIKCIFIQIEKKTLKTGTASKFEMSDSRLRSRFNRREKIFHQHPSAEYGLKA